MSKALVKKGRGSAANGLVPAVASGFLPGLGQFLNGQTEKAVGVFIVVGVAGLVSTLPLVGPLGWAVGGLGWIYAVADGYLTGKKKA